MGLGSDLVVNEVVWLKLFGSSLAPNATASP